MYNFVTKDLSFSSLKMLPILILALISFLNSIFIVSIQQPTELIVNASFPNSIYFLFLPELTVDQG